MHYSVVGIIAAVLFYLGLIRMAGRLFGINQFGANEFESPLGQPSDCAEPSAQNGAPAAKPPPTPFGPGRLD